MASAPDSIHRLVELFDRNIYDYKNSAYKEAHVRQEFINPFWSALGWDMENRAGLSMKLKEVIHEDVIEIEGNKKAPDYAFRKGEQLKFYLEAKAPKIYLKEDISPAFQIKSYAWSAGLPVSLLSDFEEFAVYQCTNRPKAGDKTIKDRIAYFGYKDYIEKWDWLYEHFSREAIWSGHFDTFANTYARKRGTQSFDKAFLADMHEWRKALAQNIALRNDWIDERDLNFAVQATLDRIIFLRIAEDRGIEKYGNLGVDAGLDYVLEAKSNKRRKVDGVYKNLLKRFKVADDRYNSGLFHFSKEKERGSHDTLTPRLEIDDKVITKIIEELYYPESPYAFDQVPADVLGSVYEQFLGQVITLSPSHKASIDYKPEVKKAGGVYYTPKYIVDYIVKNTLGKLLDDIWTSPSLVKGRDGVGLGESSTKPSVEHKLSTTDFTKLLKKARALTVLDPACGSGSFLLGAYQYLLDWYHRFYVETDPDHWLKQKAIEVLPSPSPVKDAPAGSGSRQRREHPADGLFQNRRAGEGLGVAGERPEEQHPTPPNFRLTIAERKRILLAHIHGVDIDSQAVEVAKLNLLLKASEGTAGPGQQQLAYDAKERLLPDLEKNIVCGNSLIGWDYFNKKEDTRTKSREEVNPLDYAQAFPSVMREKGFDAVIGNPPYRMLQPHNTDDYTLSYLRSKYIAADFKVDFFHLFIQRAFDLLKPGAEMGFIIPATLLNNVYVEQLRQLLTAKAIIQTIAVASEKVFEGADVHAFVLLLRKPTASDMVSDNFIRTTASLSKEFLKGKEEYGSTPQSVFSTLEGKVWNILLNSSNLPIIEKIHSSTKPLSAIASINRGLITGDRKKYFSDKKATKDHVPILTGSDVHQYYYDEPKEYVLFKRPKTSGGCWDPEVHHAPHKVVVRQIGKEPTAAFLDKPIAVTGNVFTVMSGSEMMDKAIVAILNSSWIAWYWSIMFADFKATFPQVTIFSIARVPIPELGNDLVTGLVEITERLSQLYRTNGALVSREAHSLQNRSDMLIATAFGIKASPSEIFSIQ